MKVLFVIPLLSSYCCFLQGVGKELLNKGNKVFLLTNNAHGNEIDGVKIIHLNFPRGMNVFCHLHCVSIIRRVVKDIRPDIIHTHFSANIFTVALAKEKSWPLTIATFHGLSFPVMKKGLKRILVRWAEIYSAQKMNQVCVLTEDDALALKKYIKKNSLYCYKSKGVGCDIERFDKGKYSEYQKNKLRNRLNISNTDKVIVYVGRFVAFKGFNLVAHAFNGLWGHNIKLLLLGKKDSIHTTGLSAAEEASFFDNPNVVNVGFVDNVEDYLAISDIMLFPSTKEGLPVCVMEALSMEIPVIVPNSRGCNALVFNGYNGIVLKCLKISEIIKSVKLLLSKLDDTQMLDYMKKNRKIYDRRYYINEQLDLYENLINGEHIKC
jgi:glycosyltransferase involved in cell wall biosynthesis